MDIQEAIDMEGGVTVGDSIFDTEPNESDMMLTAIFAMEELKQYLQIGTVDECRAAREKQIPQNPIMKQYDDMEDEYLCCPNCGEILTDRIPFDPKTFYFHCMNCGQALKWGD